MPIDLTPSPEIKLWLRYCLVPWEQSTPRNVVPNNNRWPEDTCLDTEGKDGNEQLEDQGQAQLPEGSVHTGPSLSYVNVVVHIGEVAPVVAQWSHVCNAALAEQHLDEPATGHTCLSAGAGASATQATASAPIKQKEDMEPSTSLYTTKQTDGQYPTEQSLFRVGF